MSASNLISTVCLLACFLVQSLSEEQLFITDPPAETVTLMCSADRNTDIGVVEWSRRNLVEYVFLYRNRRSDPDNQHPSYIKRVELKDKLMTGGDVSLVLKNVTVNDTGTYECRVKLRVTTREKRSFLETDPICVITLTVGVSGGGAGHTVVGGDKDGGDKDGHVGLVVGLSVVGVLLLFAGGFVMFKKHKAVSESELESEAAKPPHIT